MNIIFIIVRYSGRSEKDFEMLVCLCRGVCDGKVRAVIHAGAKSCTEVGAACGAGTDCGACRPMIRKMVAEKKAARLGAASSALVTEEAPSEAR